MFLLLGFAFAVFSAEGNPEGEITSSINNSFDNVVEMILQQILEAGQLVLIQIRQLIDPSGLVSHVDIQNYLSNLQKSPIAMALVGLAVVGVPLLSYRIIRTNIRRREELRELKEVLDQEEDYDYEEEEFRKIHARDEANEDSQDEEDELEEYEEDDFNEEVEKHSVATEITNEDLLEKGISIGNA